MVMEKPVTVHSRMITANRLALRLVTASQPDARLFHNRLASATIFMQLIKCTKIANRRAQKWPIPRRAGHGVALRKIPRSRESLRLNSPCPEGISNTFAI
jgi:hypothetical protein